MQETAHPESQQQQAADDPNINIQIEVDIEPPTEGEGGLSAQQLEKMGLPSHHVHYTAGGGVRQQQQQPAGAELLAPSDIQVSYTLSEEDVRGWEEAARMAAGEGAAGGRKRPLVESMLGVQAGLGLEDYQEPDPPRALPSTPDLSDSGVGGPGGGGGGGGLVDSIYTVEAFCNLDCGVDGRCHVRRQGDDWAKRCLCPMGRDGEFCQLEVDVGVPQLAGLGHLALPTLQNAYSDLHMSLEFKPTSWTGILLLTGETDDMTGDYLALLLDDGYVELRYVEAVVGQAGPVQVDKSVAKIILDLT